MKRNVLVLAAMVAASALASSVHAEDFSNPSVNSFWSESYTDSSGNYISPASNTSVSGGVLTAPIPTNAVQSSPDNNVVNYVRTRSDLAGASANYNGSLLGNLSSQTSITATFNLTNSTLSPGAAFQLSQLVGEGTTDPSTPGDPSLRLVFTGTGDVNADGAGDIEPNEWWSTAGVSVTSMDNGQDVSLTVNLDSSLWSNFDGKLGTDSLVSGQFAAALSNVSLLGISFGSGDFYSDGFAFNTGGTAALNLDSIATTGPSAVPLPPAVWSGLALLSGLGLVAGINRFRRQLA